MHRSPGPDAEQLARRRADDSVDAELVGLLERPHCLPPSARRTPRRRRSVVAADRDLVEALLQALHLRAGVAAGAASGRSRTRPPSRGRRPPCPAGSTPWPVVSPSTPADRSARWVRAPPRRPSSPGLAGFGASVRLDHGRSALAVGRLRCVRRRRPASSAGPPPRWWPASSSRCRRRRRRRRRAERRAGTRHRRRWPGWRRRRRSGASRSGDAKPADGAPGWTRRCRRRRRRRRRAPRSARSLSAASTSVGSSPVGGQHLGQIVATGGRTAVGSSPTARRSSVTGRLRRHRVERRSAGTRIGSGSSCRPVAPRIRRLTGPPPPTVGSSEGSSGDGGSGGSVGLTAVELSRRSYRLGRRATPPTARATGRRRRSAPT